MLITTVVSPLTPLWCCVCFWCLCPIESTALFAMKWPCQLVINYASVHRSDVSFLYVDKYIFMFCLWLGGCFQQAIDQLVRVAIWMKVIAVLEIANATNVRNFICSFHFLSLLQFIFARRRNKKKDEHAFLILCVDVFVWTKGPYRINVVLVNGNKQKWVFFFIASHFSLINIKVIFHAFCNDQMVSQMIFLLWSITNFIYFAWTENCLNERKFYWRNGTFEQSIESDFHLRSVYTDEWKCNTICKKASKREKTIRFYSSANDAHFL